MDCSCHDSCISLALVVACFKLSLAALVLLLRACEVWASLDLTLLWSGPCVCSSVFCALFKLSCALCMFFWRIGTTILTARASQVSVLFQPWLMLFSTSA